MANLTSSTVLSKQPRERFQVGMNFANILRYGDVITGTPYITIEPSGEITMSDVFAGFEIAYATIEGGTSPHNYRFQFEVVTTSGFVYLADSVLKCRDR